MRPHLKIVFLEILLKCDMLYITKFLAYIGELRDGERSFRFDGFCYFCEPLLQSIVRIFFANDHIPRELEMCLKIRVSALMSNSLPDEWRYFLSERLRIPREPISGTYSEGVDWGFLEARSCRGMMRFVRSLLPNF